MFGELISKLTSQTLDYNTNTTSLQRLQLMILKCARVWKQRGGTASNTNAVEDR